MRRETLMNSQKNLLRIAVTIIVLILLVYRYKIWVNAPVDPPKAHDVSVKTISWEDADKYYGCYVTVKGKITDTHNTGKVCFLNFHPNYRRFLTLVIFKSDFKKFSEKPEQYYKGKSVRVSGFVKKYQDKPEIILKNKKQISITEL